MRIDVETIHAAFVALNLVDKMAAWKVFAERSAAAEGEIPGASCTFHHKIGIKDGAKMVAEISWRSHLMND